MNGTEKLNLRVFDLLTRMGVPDHTAGYSFLHTAILSVYEQPYLLVSIIESLYVVIAQKHKTTAEHVEEELEYILLATLLFGDHVMQQKVLHTLYYRQPTLREFIEMSLQYMNANRIGDEECTLVKS